MATNRQECHNAATSRDASDDVNSYLAIYGDSYRRLLLRNAGVYSGTVIRRDVMITAGGLPPGLTYADDWTFFLNVARIAEWHTVPTRLGFTRIHPRQTTGASANGRTILVAHLSVVFGGRPFPEHVSAHEWEKAREAYGRRVYRQLVQELLWDSLRRGEWRLALELRRLGRPLVERWRDWIYVQLPPTVTHRFRCFRLPTAVGSFVRLSDRARVPCPRSAERSRGGDEVRLRAARVRRRNGLGSDRRTRLSITPPGR